MPQKRKRVVRDATLPVLHDDAPSLISPRTNTEKGRPKAARRKLVDGYGLDDTPKAFARLMQLKSTGHYRQGLDDGFGRQSKRQKLGQADRPKLEVPNILPGEKLADFSARVDQALPIAGLNRKGVKYEEFKPRQSKIEKKIQKKIAVWRREEASRVEREQDARDEAEEQEAETWADGGILGDSQARKKGKTRHVNGSASDDEDPWEVLKLSRNVQRGLHDIVQEPPQLKAPVKHAFKIKEGAAISVADVPASAGSLRRREALTNTRRDVIDSYRQLMKDKRNGK